MKRYFCWLGYLWVLLAMPLAANTSRIYVLNVDADTINVIDTATNRVVQTIEGIRKPHGAVFSLNGSLAYVTSETDEHNLYVVDTKTGKIINKVLLSGRPNLPAISKDGGRVLVCIRDQAIADTTSQENHLDNENRVAKHGGAIDIVDTASLKVKTIPMKGMMHDCYVTPDGKYLLAGSSEGHFLSVIDLQTEKPAWEVPFDRGVQTIATEVGPDGSTRRIFIDLKGFHGFAVVDFATHEEVARIELPDQRHFIIAEKERDEATPSHGTAVAPDGKTLWVTSRSSNAAIAYSLPELKLLGYVPMPEATTIDLSPGQSLNPQLNVAGHPPLGGDPTWLTFAPDSKTVYVANSDAKIVSAIDVKTMKEVARIPVGKQAKRMATLVLP